MYVASFIVQIAKILKNALNCNICNIIRCYLWIFVFRAGIAVKNVSAHNLGAWLRLRRAETKAVKTIVRE